MLTPELKARREAIVQAHVDAENRADWQATADTFGRPRYEVVPTGEVLDGRDAVIKLLSEFGAAFPDLRIETTRMHHADDAVICEAVLSGTQLGAWRGLPPTGARIRYPSCNVFDFDGDQLVCERLYFDMMTVLRQVGIARDPLSFAGRAATFLNHPLTIGRALLRAATGGKEAR
jgi:steroid delta-isomerase-like uncharacterized protein